MTRPHHDSPADDGPDIIPLPSPTGGVTVATLLETLAARVVADRNAAGRPLVGIAIQAAEGWIAGTELGPLRDAVRLLLEAACDASAAAPVRLREVTITAVETRAAIEIEVADAGDGPPATALAAVRPRAEWLGGSLATAACPEGGVAATLRLPRRRAQSRAA